MVMIPIPKVSGFVIYNPKTGLFSKGGSYSFNDTDRLWSKTPKIWKAIGHVKNHLSQYVGNLTKDYNNNIWLYHVSNVYFNSLVLDITDTSNNQKSVFNIQQFMLEKAENKCKRYGYSLKVI